MSAVIPAGYKQTEVGTIPGDWEVDRLDKFWSVTDCKHVTAQFISSGYPLASIKEVQSRFVDLGYAKQTNHQFYNLLIDSGRKPEAGDLIVSRNATVGEIAQVAAWHPLFAMGQDVCLLRKRKSDFSSDYLQSIFKSNVIIGQLADAMVGSTFKRINVQQIKSFKIPMPGTAEQRAIAAALSDVDALLAKLDQLVAKKRDLKQAAMQQLLTGQTRLPGFSGEWEVKRLGDVAEVLKGSGLSKGVYGVAGTRKCILYGELFTTYRQVIVEVVGRTNSPDGRISQIGDVLVPGSTTTDGIDLATASAILEDEVALGGDINIIRCKSKNQFSPQFLANYLTTVKKQEISERAQGTTIVHLYGRDLADLLVDCPSLQEQTAIATVLSDMDTELAALEARRDKTRALKQGMMQKLLTGRIRLV